VCSQFFQNKAETIFVWVKDDKKVETAGIYFITRAQLSELTPSAIKLLHLPSEQTQHFSTSSYFSPSCLFFFFFFFPFLLILSSWFSNILDTFLPSLSFFLPSFLLPPFHVSFLF
jgi:membrane protein insertase Oxa1/YidC/SpoIIIJ